MKPFAFIIASFAMLAFMQAYAAVETYAGETYAGPPNQSSDQDLNAPFRVAGETCSIDQPSIISVNAQVCGNDVDVDIL
jgi:hypothetical protein